MRYRPSVYVAGPYSSTVFMQGLENMRHGLEISAKFIKIGWSVFSPFLDYQFIFFQPTLTREDYLEHSLEQVSRQDILYVLEGWESSEGTKAEIAEALELNIPIFYEVNVSPMGVNKHYIGLYGDNIKEGKTAWR